MKKDIRMLILIFAVGVVSMATSCKKNNDAPSRSQMLIGTWQVTRLYEDNNNNGVADSDEIVQDTTLSHEWFSFYTNGKLIVAYYTNLTDYKWGLAGNNTYIDIIDSFTFSNANTYYHIDTLTSTTLVLKDTTGASYGGTNWTILTKI